MEVSTSRRHARRTGTYTRFRIHPRTNLGLRFCSGFKLGRLVEHMANAAMISWTHPLLDHCIGLAYTFHTSAHGIPVRHPYRSDVVSDGSGRSAGKTERGGFTDILEFRNANDDTPYLSKLHCRYTWPAHCRPAAYPTKPGSTKAFSGAHTDACIRWHGLTRRQWDVTSGARGRTVRGPRSTRTSDRGPYGPRQTRHRRACGKEDVHGV